MTPADIRARLAERLTRRGLAMPAISFSDALRPVTDGVPEGWAAGGNLLLTDGMAGSVIGTLPGPPPTGALVVAQGTAPAAILLSGADATVVLGANTALDASWLACKDGATIAIGSGTRCTGDARVDARNGGTIVVGEDGLWAVGVMLSTDHMHAIRDLSGKRLNAFGGTVEVGRHVWLGHEAMLMPGARIGADTVIGARAVVARPLPGNAVCAGIPARVLRERVTWSFEDLP